MGVAVVTGANSGIGKAIATGLAEHGFEVVLACRDAGRGEAARAAIVAATGNAAVELLLCDLSRPASVRAFAATLAARRRHIDVLVHNAGIYLPRRVLTAEGREMMFAV